MLNKNNLLESEKVVDFILDIALMYDGKSTNDMNDILFNILKEEGFISDKVRSVFTNMWKWNRTGSYKEGIRFYIYERYHTNRTSSNYFSLSKEAIDKWLGQ